MGLKAVKTTILTSVIITIAVFSIMLTGYTKIKSNEINRVVLEVDYFNSWEGTISIKDANHTISGFGRKIITLVRPNTDIWDLSIKIR